MVSREQGINGMESERVPLVDARKTYVSRTTDERPELIICLSQSGDRQKHASVCDVFMALFEGVHDAY
jgi:hypothetical protein